MSPLDLKRLSKVYISRLVRGMTKKMHCCVKANENVLRVFFIYAVKADQL